MTERYETSDAEDPTLPWAATPDQTTIFELGTNRELLRMRGLVPLPIGAIVQLGAIGDLSNLPWDGIVREVRLWGAVPGGRPLLRLDVELVPPA
jgi:hypothetical protein